MPPKVETGKTPDQKEQKPKIPWEGWTPPVPGSPLSTAEEDYIRAHPDAPRSWLERNLRRGGGGIDRVRSGQQASPSKSSQHELGRVMRLGDDAESIQLTPEIFQGRQEAPGITIDPLGSKDHDDAIFIDLVNGKPHISVSIADVSALILAGSFIDRQAQTQAFSRYFATGNQPMLPRPLSEGSLSLLSGERRPTVTVSFVLGQNLDVENIYIARTWIASKQTLSYEEADQIIRDKSGQFAPMLRAGYEIARALLDKRRQKGALAIYDLASGWVTSEDGVLRRINPDEAHLSNLMIQELMIMTNQIIAQFCAEHDIPTLYRNHAARSNAPTHEMIVQDIEKAIAYPRLLDIKTVQERLRLVLQRASYERILRGHFALNLAAYLHFTSPLRRYPDLAVHRNLIAFLYGEELPHLDADLDRIGGHVNGIENAIKDQRQAGIAARDKERARTAGQYLGSKELASLAPEDFYRVIKVVAQENQLSPDLVEAIRVRLHSGKLGARDLYLILLESGESEQWDFVRTEVVDWLADNPTDSVSILSYTVPSKGWSPVEFHVDKRGPGHRPVFTATARVAVDNQRYISSPARALTQKHAEKAAAVKLLRSILQLGGESIDEPVQEVPAPIETNQPNQVIYEADTADSFDHWQELHKISQQKHWKKPIRQVNEQRDQSGQTIFTAVARVTIQGTVYASDPIQRGDSKTAVQGASLNLLAKLARVDQLKASIPASYHEPLVESGVTAPTQPAIEPRKPEENYKNKLQEICQQQGADLPSYTTTRSGTEHQPVFTSVAKVVIQAVAYVSDPVTASNKLEAEKLAARQLVEHLQQEH